MTSLAQRVNHCSSRNLPPSRRTSSFHALISWNQYPSLWQPSTSRSRITLEPSTPSSTVLHPTILRSRNLRVISLSRTYLLQHPSEPRPSYRVLQTMIPQPLSYIPHLPSFLSGHSCTFKSIASRNSSSSQPSISPQPPPLHSVSSRLRDSHIDVFSDDLLDLLLHPSYANFDLSQVEFSSVLTVLLFWPGNFIQQVP